VSDNPTDQAPAEPPAVDDAAALEMTKKLAEHEQAGVRLQLSVGPYTAFTLIGAIQLVLRHPGVEGLMARVLTDLARQFQAALADGPVPGVGELIELGFDERYDR
jgi:hypothetical protein